MILRLEHVTKSYGSHRALDGVTADVAPGTIGLLGPNGAGKSTLIKALLGLVSLTSGRARVLGLDPTRQARAIREQVGFMPEDDCTIPGLKGVEAVALCGELAGLPALTALRRAHEILDYVLLDADRYRPVEDYSVGMRQKVKLAQALIHAPKLLFLDEPTNGLDPVGRQRMVELIGNLWRRRGITVVLSTHILADVERCCDAAMILGRGRLLVHDTIESLRKTADPSCTVRVAGDAAPLIPALAARGIEAEAVDREHVRARLAGPVTNGADPQLDLGDLVLAAARESRVELREIAAGRNSLEDIYRRAVQATAEPRPATGGATAISAAEIA